MRRAATTVLFAMLAGCAADARMSPLSADHPANPDAPTAPLAQSTALTAMTMTMTTTQPATKPAVASALYVCPMHPEVTSPHPKARCSICSMFLVPKKGAGQ